MKGKDHCKHEFDFSWCEGLVCRHCGFHYVEAVKGKDMDEVKRYYFDEDEGLCDLTKEDEPQCPLGAEGQYVDESSYLKEKEARIQAESKFRVIKNEGLAQITIIQLQDKIAELESRLKLNDLPESSFKWRYFKAQDKIAEFEKELEQYSSGIMQNRTVQELVRQHDEKLAELRELVRVKHDALETFYSKYKNWAELKLYYIEQALERKEGL